MPRFGTTWLIAFCHINLKNHIHLHEFFYGLNRDCFFDDISKQNFLEDDFFTEETRHILLRTIKKNNDYQNVIKFLNLYSDFVLKTQITQLNAFSKSDFMDLSNLMDHRIKIIRRDLIESTISFVYSLYSDDWSSSNRPRKKFLIDINFFKETLYARKKEYEILEQLEVDDTVYYEDISKDPLKIWNSLGIEKKEEVILPKKIKNPPKENYVENYEQLVEIGKKIINE